MKSEELLRYSKQIQLNQIGLAGQRRLSQARVLCIGAGGLGSPLLLYLAAAGVGTVGIIDEDSIQLSNLHRQILYPHDQIGEKKVKIAAQTLLALNPHLKIETYDQYFNLNNARQLVKCYDIIADCSDNFATRYLVNDSCFAEKKPFVSASIFQWSGQCSVFLGNESACYRCLFPQPPDEGSIPDCNQAGVLGVLPGLLGVIQATEILKWILQIGDLLTNRLLLIDIETMQFRQLQYQQDPNCLVCVKKQFNTSDYFQNPAAITPHELRELITSQQDFLLLDIRKPEEYALNHLGGILIPLSDLATRLTELNPQVLTVIYCKSGLRSKQAAKILNAANFRAVKYLQGGLDAYTDAYTHVTIVK